MNYHHSSGPFVLHVRLSEADKEILQYIQFQKVVLEPFRSSDVTVSYGEFHFMGKSISLLSISFSRVVEADTGCGTFQPSGEKKLVKSFVHLYRSILMSDG